MMCGLQRRRQTIALINSIKTVITDPEKSLNVPNAITASRAVIAIVAAFLFASENQASFYWGIALFTCAGLTDLVDGWLARKTGQVSDLGKMLDPVADKIAIFALLQRSASNWDCRFGYQLFTQSRVDAANCGRTSFSKVGRPLQANVWGKPPVWYCMAERFCICWGTCFGKACK